MTTLKVPAPGDLKNLDPGLYREAESKGLSPLAYLVSRPENQPDPEHVERVFEKAKGRIKADMLSPSRLEAIHKFAREHACLEAFYTHMPGFEHGIPGDMKASDFANLHTKVTTGEYLGIGGSQAVLFPAWVDSQVQMGVIGTGYVDDICFETRTVDAFQVKNLYLTDADWTTSRSATSTTAEGYQELAYSMEEVGEHGELPLAQLNHATTTIYLKKFGRLVDASYEVLTSTTVDLLALQLQRIGQRIAVDETDRALHYVIAGDGSTPGAAETNTSDYDNTTVGYAGLITWVTGLPNREYRIDTAFLGITDLRSIMNLAEFKDPDVGRAQAALGFGGPLQVRYIRWQGGLTGSSYVDRLVVGLDTRYAMRRFQYGGNIPASESENVISNQSKRVSVARWSGFQKWNNNAVYVWDTAAAL